MRFRKLLPLLALFGILGLIAVIQKRQPGPANLADEAGLKPLATTSLAADDIRGIDLYYGTNRQDTLKLRRQDKTWVAAHYYDAPLQGAKINTLLRVLTHLQGELRVDRAELLKNFQLESGQAYHLRIFTRSFDRPAVHLLVGKRRSTIGFVRFEDDTRVYSVGSGLFSILGLQPAQAGAPPATKAWLDLQIQNIAERSIETLELRTPQRTWQFSRSLTATSNQTAAASRPVKRPQWVLTHPVVEFPLKQSHVNGLISTLRTLRAEDVTSSDQLAAYGLINPAYAATLSWRTDADSLQTSVISVGHEVPQQKGKRYARRDHSGPVYILPQWSFKRLFIKPEQLLDLPALDTQPDALRRIVLSTPGRTVQFDRATLPVAPDNPTSRPSDWRLTHPAVDFELRQERFTRWVKDLTSFSPAELAPESFKPDATQHTTGPTIKVVLENGTHKTLRLGPVIDPLAPHHALYFNTFSTPFAITQATRQAIFPPLRDILILRPLNAKPDDVIRLTWQMGPQRWRLERARIAVQPDGQAHGAWQVVDSQQAEIDPHQVATAIQRIVDLTAEDWVETPEQAWHDAAQPLMLSLGLTGNRTIQLTVLQRDTLIGLMSSNLPGLFILPEGTYTPLQASLTALAAVPTSLSTAIQAGKAPPPGPLPAGAGER